MMGLKRELIDGTKWTLTEGGMFVCPCDWKVEDDGRCPNGHVSPLREEGYI